MTYASPRFYRHAENCFKESCVGLAFVNGESLRHLSIQVETCWSEEKIGPCYSDIILDLFDQNSWQNPIFCVSLYKISK